MKSLLKLATFLLLINTIAACGGGSSAPGITNAPAPVTTTTPAPEVATTATVGIILTDASVDDYDHAWVTITSVELLGEEGNELIFSGEERVDLLALRDTLKLFAVNENVEPGDFNKIRMFAKDMVLVVDQEDGESIETPVDLVANGKIDLNPRGTFSLAAGDVVFVSLDWNMRESLKLTETGNGNGKIIMRPVIFVDIGTEPAFKQGLVRVFGIVDLVAADYSNFRICSTEASTQPVSSLLLESLCLDILLTEKTGLFDADGNPVDATELKAGDPLTVLGLLRRTMDGPDTTPLEDAGGEVRPTIFQVLSIVVEGGVSGTWKPVRGVLQTGLDDIEQTFEIFLRNSQGEISEVAQTVKVFDQSRVFSISLDTGLVEVTAADLMTDDRVALDVTIAPVVEEGDPELLHAAIILARAPGDADIAIEGSILTIDVDAGSLELATAGGILQCVMTDADTLIFEVFISDDSAESVPATLADLTVGSKAGIVGTEVVDACFAAALIIAEGQHAEPK